MPDFGFVGAAYQAQSIYQDDQELINWYVEKDMNDEKKTPEGQASRGVTTLYPTPGYITQATLPTLGCRALWTLPGGLKLLAVYGNTLYSINTSLVATSIGTLLSSSGPVSMTDNGSSAYLVDGLNRYAYNYITSTFTTIGPTDGAFTGGVKVDIVDGFLVYTQPNGIDFGSTSVNSTASPQLSFGTKFTAPDNVMSLIVVNRNVFLIGEKTTEVYINAGSFPFPFAIIPGTSMQHGTIASFSVSRLGESFAMISQDTRGQAVVIQMNGFTPVRISTHAVEYAFSTYSTLSDAQAFTYQDRGHEFYVLSFPTADVTWVYDLATQLWHKRAFRDSNNLLHRIKANCQALFNGLVVVGDFGNGNLYSFSNSTFTEAGVGASAGAIIPCIRRAPHLTTDLKRQYFHDFQIQFQPGVGLQSGQGSNPTAMLKWSDDGGSTFSKEHWTSIGLVGQYKNRAIWRRLGQARDRIFEVQVTDPVYRVVVSANLNASVGAA